MKKRDRTASLIWLLFAVYICIESLRLPLGSLRDPGPGFLPLVVGVILGVLSVVNFGQARAENSRSPGGSWYSQERWKRLVGVLVALFVYAGVLDLLGFLTSTFLLLIYLFRYGLEPRKWVWAIGGSAMASVSCYVVFDLWLQTQLPKGIFGF